MLIFALRHPSLPGHECRANAIVIDPQIAVAAAPDRAWHHPRHLLRDDADIFRRVVAVVTETVKADAVLKLRDPHDVLFQQEV